VKAISLRGTEINDSRSQFPYGFGSWPGGLAHFAYNDTCCEGYEGYVKVGQFSFWVA
jgi:hypothetical protein